MIEWIPEHGLNRLTEIAAIKDRDQVLHQRLQTAMSEFPEGRVACIESGTVIMIDANSASIGRSLVGATVVAVGNCTGMHTRLEGKHSDRRDTDGIHVWELHREEDETQDVLNCEQWEQMSKRKHLDQQEANNTWMGENRATLGATGNSNGLRRRKRKQDSEKIHRGTCDWNVISSEEEPILVEDSPKKVGNDWVAVVPGSPGEMGSKYCSGDEIRTTSKVQECFFSGDGYTHKNDHDSLSQEEEEASGERGSDLRHPPGGSQSNKICERESIDICNGVTCESVTGENVGETHMQAQDQLLEFVSRDVPLKDHGSNGDARELYMSSVSRIVELLSDKFWDVENGDENILNLEDTLLKERAENEKMRAEIAVTKDKLNFFLNLAEKGSRKCTYCWSVKEKLSMILKSDLQRTDASAGPVGVDTGAEFNSIHTLETRLAKRCRSPVGSCTYEILKEDEGNANHDDEASLKRKRDFKEQSIFGEDKESTLFFNCTLLKKSDIVPKIGNDVDVKRCPRYSQRVSPNTENSKLSKCLDIGKCESEEFLGTVKTNKKELPWKMNFQVEKEAFGLEAIKDSNAVREYSFTTVNTYEDEDMVVVDGHEDGQRFVSSVGVEELYKDLKGLTGNIFEVDFVDLKCGCRSQVHGDTVGILRVQKTGLLEIHCQCSAICEQGAPMTPAAFERHAGRGSSRKWKDSIWVMLGGEKLQFSKVKSLDALYRHYKNLNYLKVTQNGSVKQQYHRDEFISCHKCLKERRFRRRNKNECRAYHDASFNPNWECSNYPSDRSMSCDDEDEREVRRAIRGCVRLRTCQGCIACVCLGCSMCRFHDCDCRICEDYLANC